MIIAEVLRSSIALLSTFTIVFYTLADVFQAYEPQFPLAPMVLLGGGAHVTAMLLVVAHGAKTVDDFLLWPRDWSAQFVFAHMLTWLAATVPIFGSQVYLVWLVTSSGRVYGTLFTCGAVSVALHWLLFSSRLLLARSKELRISHTGYKALAVSVFATSTVVAMVAAELVPSMLLPAVLISSAFHLGSGVLIYGLVGEGFQVFAFAGSKPMVLLQWLTFVVYCIVGILFAMQLRAELIVLTRISYVSVAVGGLAFCTQIATVVLAWVARSTHTAAKYCDCDSLSIALTAIQLVVGCALGAPFLFSSSDSASAFLAYGVDPLIVASALLTPLTHATGMLRYQSEFSFWDPFGGGTAYVCVQILGWFQYAVALFLVFIELVNRFLVDSTAASGDSKVDFRPVMAILFALGQCCVHASLYYFSPSCSPTATRRKSSTLENRESIAYFNREMILSVIMAVFSFVMFVTMDFLVPTAAFPMLPAYYVASGLALTAPLLMQLALGSELPAAVVQSPFAGSPEYVAFQTVGWVTYSFQVIGTVVVIALINPSMLLSIQTHYPALFSWIGFAAQLSCLSLLASVHYHKKTIPISRGEACRSNELATLVQSLDPSDANALRALASGDTAVLSPRVQALLQSLAEVALLRREDPTSHLNHDFEGIRAVVYCAAISSFALFALAEVVLQSHFVFTVCLAGCAMGLSTTTCCVLHFRYARFHLPEYSAIPMKGGARFLVLQIVSWGSLYGCFLLVSAVLWLPQRRFFGLLAIAGFMSVVAQLLLVKSLKAFRPLSTVSSPTVFDIHSEGLVSVLLLVSALVISFLVDIYPRYTDGPTPIYFIPLLVFSVSAFSLSVPLAIIALYKSRFKPFAASGFTVGPLERQDSVVAALEGIDEGEEGESGAQVVGSLLERVVICTLVVVCALLASLVYYFLHSIDARILLDTSRVVVAVSAALLSLTLVGRTAEKLIPQPILDLRNMVVTFLLMSFPAWFVASILSIPLVRPVPGAVVFAANVAILVIANRIRAVINLCNFLALGFCIYRLLRTCVPHPFLAADLWTPGSGNCDASTALESVCWVIAIIRYHRTYASRGEENGSRRSPRAIQFLQRWILRSVEGYFQYRVIVDPRVRALQDNPRQCIIGFHPHGIFPFTSIWGLLHKDWRHQVKHFIDQSKPTTVHAASVIFATPFLRDVAMALGSCAVTRTAIEESIASGRSVVIVPGGQAEMIVSQAGNRVSLVSKHKGFIRLALYHGLSLVPTFCFGEHDVMSNISLPRTQRFFLKLFGLGFPVLPYGRWFLPVPRAAKLTLLVAGIIHLEPNQHASEQVVEDLTKQYFAMLKESFYAHRADAGYPDLELEIID